MTHNPRMHVNKNIAMTRRLATIINNISDKIKVGHK